jgi:hypothetical protein
VWSIKFLVSKPLIRARIRDIYCLERVTVKAGKLLAYAPEFADRIGFPPNDFYDAAARKLEVLTAMRVQFSVVAAEIFDRAISSGVPWLAEAGIALKSGLEPRRTSNLPTRQGHARAKSQNSEGGPQKLEMKSVKRVLRTDDDLGL